MDGGDEEQFQSSDEMVPEEDEEREEDLEDVNEEHQGENDHEQQLEEDEGGNNDEAMEGVDGNRAEMHEDGEEVAEEEELEEVPDPDNADSALEEYAEEEDGQVTPVGGETNNNQETEENEEEEDASSKRKRTASHSSGDDGPKRKQVRSSGSVSGQRHDTYCWVCHKDGVQAFCKICPRAYHAKCMHLVPDDSSKSNQAVEVTKTCICPECTVVMNAENLETRSETMKKLTVDQLITMLKCAIQRMKGVPGVEPFQYPVDPEEALDYFNYIVYPMDLYALENNVKKRQYGSTEAFLADAQWLVHNSVVFNSVSSPFTAIAKKILKVCRQEIQDIETCPECYINAHNIPDVWFIEACKRPHVIVWAKLKGFPFWPAKAMRIKDDMVDVRFFGAHDRAWVVRKDCFLYSEENPSASAAPKRNTGLIASIEELTAHIAKLKEHHGPFVFAAARTPIGPQLSIEQIRQMLPEYKPDDIGNKLTAAGNPAKKSPMTIRISSLKTNPTIVNNSVIDEAVSNTSAQKVQKEAEVEKHETSKAEDSQTLEPNEDKQTSEDNETSPDKSKPAGILATVLSRNARRSSRSETGSASPEHAEKKVVRAVTKSDAVDESMEQQRESTPPPSKHFLKSLGLMKASEAKQIQRKPVVPHLGKLLHPSEVFVKDEPEDTPEDEYSDGGGEGLSNNHCGMRFNLSKDISISPVGDDNEEPHQQRRPVVQGHNARIMPGLLSQIAQRPRLITSSNGTLQRMAGIGQQNRLIMRQQRPGVPVRPGNKTNGPPRPQSMQVVKHQLLKPKETNSTLVIDPSTLQQGAVQLNQVQSIQGAITLPGGTITVTPLAPVINISDGSLNGGQVVVKQNLASSANGLPISVMTSHEGNSLLKSNNKSNPQRKNLINQVPSSVGHLVQNLQKTLVENVKTTMEQIVVEMLEKTGSATGGPEAKTLKDENEKLRKQLAEYKHNHDSNVRELKMAMEADKKRALAEQRKQLEQDKMKLIEETKKKQWCARCGREAQFYCCWNTSYCGYPCQEDHWPSHMSGCSQSSRQ